MKLKKRLLAVGTMFLLAGQLLAQDLVPQDKPQHHHRSEAMKAELGLTDAQTTQIQAIRDKYRPQMQALRQTEGTPETNFAAIKELRKTEQAEIDKVLTPEQRTKMETFRKTHHQGGHHKHKHHKAHGPNAEAHKEARQYYKSEVLPVLQAQRLKLEADLTPSDKAEISRLRTELAALRPDRKDFHKKKTKHQWTQEDIDKHKAIHEQRRTLMDQARTIADRYEPQILALRAEIQPQSEVWKAEFARIHATKQQDTHHHKHHSKGGLHHMRPTHFILLDPAAPTPATKQSLDTQSTLQVFPNPATNRATLRYNLPAASKVRVELLAQDGKVLQVLSDTQQEAGEHLIDLETTQLTPGTYFFRITDGTAARVKPLTVVH